MRTADVERFLERFKEKPDYRGARPAARRIGARALRHHLARMRPARITYVSCEPPTLARDLAVSLTAGYEISDDASLRSFPANIPHGDSRTRLRRRA